MSRAESAKILKNLLNDELCTLVACRQAMERVKEPATVAELRHIAGTYEDSISRLRAAIIDRAEEPLDDPQVIEPWSKLLHKMGNAMQSDAILAQFQAAEELCRDRVARAVATVEGLDETARRMVGEIILPRHKATLASLDTFAQARLATPDDVAARAAAQAAKATATATATAKVHVLHAAKRAEPAMAAAALKVKKASEAAVEAVAAVEVEAEPDLLGTVQHFAAQLARAGLIAGAYGLAVATQPFRYLLRRGLGLVGLPA